MSADMNFREVKRVEVKRVLFTPIKPPKLECLIIYQLRQKCLDLPEDPTCGGYVFDDWTLYELMTNPLQPYKRLKNKN
jgi:hypothetical protein